MRPKERDGLLAEWRTLSFRARSPLGRGSPRPMLARRFGEHSRRQFDVETVTPTFLDGHALMFATAWKVVAQRVLTETRIREIKPLRYAGKVSDRRGLYLLVASNGSRYWRYNYRFQHKSRTLALGIYPDVSLEKARARQEARCLLPDGVDPSTQRGKVREHGALLLISPESLSLER